MNDGVAEDLGGGVGPDKAAEAGQTDEDGAKRKDGDKGDGSQ